MRCSLLVLMLLLGCGRTGLDDSDRRRTDAAHDGARELSAVDAAAAELPTAGSVDCLAGGEVTWDEVAVCPRDDAPGIHSCGPGFTSFGREVRLRARCTGNYAFCGRIESLDGCLITERCESGTIDDPSRSLRLVLPRVPPQFGSCAAGAAEEFGARVCARVQWFSDGHPGSEELGCFAEFGPWCLPDCGETPPGPGDGGGSGPSDDPSVATHGASWTFGADDDE